MQLFNNSLLELGAELQSGALTPLTHLEYIHVVQHIPLPDLHGISMCMSYLEIWYSGMQKDVSCHHQTE